MCVCMYIYIYIDVAVSSELQCDNKITLFADVPHLVKNLRNCIDGGQDTFLPDQFVTKYNLPSNCLSNI